MMFAPSVEISPITFWRTPVPSATTTTTAATPMRMPSTVRLARSLDRPIARRASRIAESSVFTEASLVAALVSCVASLRHHRVGAVDGEVAQLCERVVRLRVARVGADAAVAHLHDAARARGDVGLVR